MKFHWNTGTSQEKNFLMYIKKRSAVESLHRGLGLTQNRFYTHITYSVKAFQEQSTWVVVGEGTAELSGIHDPKQRPVLWIRVSFVVS